MNKKTLKIAGWALGLSLAVAGVGVVAAEFQSINRVPSIVLADEEPTSGTITYSPTSTSAASISGTYPTAATVTFANTYTSNKEQMTSGNSQTWTFSGLSGKKIKTITADLHRNSSKGTGTASLTNNGNSVSVVKSTYERADLTSSYSTYNIVTSEFICAGDIVFTLSATENSLFCNKVQIAWENNVSYVAESLDLSPSSSLTIDGNNVVTTKTGTITYSVGYDGDEGDGLVNVTITKDDAATDGLTYSDNGSGTITLTGRQEGDYVVTVSTKDKDSGGNPISHSVDVTVQNLLEPTYPTKVTSTSGLHIGDKIYLVNESAGVAAGAISSTYLSAETIEITDGEITDAGDAVEFVLGRNGSNYTFRSGSNYLGTTAAKNINLSSSGTTTWDLSFSSSNAVITSTTGSYGQIYYNSGSPRFLNYTSTQTAIQMYVISASDAEVAAEFENTYLVMGEDVSGQCNTYYANAKTTFATLTNNQINFLSSAALDRLAAWAAAKGDSFDTDTKSFSAAGFVNAWNNNAQSGNMPLGIAIASLGLIGAGGFVLIARKRKEDR
ncbi:MAG: hypothetical protein SPL80_09315 [Bacilli bacterium]|nr:hypothetical protein [Bacilli bacterium]